MTTCERIGHQFRGEKCLDCGAALADMPLAVGQRVYDPRRLPVGAVISSPSCGPVTVTGVDGEFLHTTECRCGESQQIRLGAASWRAGDSILESLPAEPQFCPDCGAGVVQSDEHGIVMRLHKDFPFEKPCPTCAERGRRAMEELGRRMAEEREAALIKALLGEGSP